MYVNIIYMLSSLIFFFLNIVYKNDNNVVWHKLSLL